MSVKIIVDSTTDLLPSIREQVTVVPLTVCFGQEEFTDGITITHEQFYEKLVESDILPTTSQASPSAFMKVFDEVLGPDDSAVVLTISSPFLQSFPAPTKALSLLPENLKRFSLWTAAP